MFRIYEFCFFLFFVLFRRIDFCIGWLVIFSMSWMLNNEMYSFFLNFLNWVYIFNNQVFLRCFLHCAHTLHILVSIILVLSWHLHFISVYWFFSFKNWIISAFSYFRHFFGLQLISFNMRQYWEFDYKLFPKFPLMTIYCSLLPAWVLIKTTFCLWIFFCCLWLFYDQFNFWVIVKSCCLAYVQQGRNMCYFWS